MSSAGFVVDDDIHDAKNYLDIKNVDPGHARRLLADLASEILQLQENPRAEPRRTGIFVPEELHHWTTVLPRECRIIQPRPDVR